MKLVSVLLALWMQVPTTPATAPATTPSTPTAPIIDAIRVQGARKTQNSSQSLMYVIQSRRGDPVNRAVIARDVRALYAREQFDDIWVEIEETTPGRAVLVFNVTEKPSLRNVDYKGLSSIQVSDVL
ncbi:MAG TPA: POTRA domain-containing protein, partial [Terriglobia bacterium]|nr:POTRA domain-containing protein [Terriglobia bacterium]